MICAGTSTPLSGNDHAGHTVVHDIRQRKSSSTKWLTHPFLTPYKNVTYDAYYSDISSMTPLVALSTINISEKVG
jgi:hypothetical protein